MELLTITPSYFENNLPTFSEQSMPKNCQHFYVHMELGIYMQQIIIHGKCIISLMTTILHCE